MAGDTGAAGSGGVCGGLVFYKVTV